MGDADVPADMSRSGCCGKPSLATWAMKLSWRPAVWRLGRRVGRLALDGGSPVSSLIETSGSSTPRHRSPAPGPGPAWRGSHRATVTTVNAATSVAPTSVANPARRTVRRRRRRRCPPSQISLKRRSHVGVVTAAPGAVPIGSAWWMISSTDMSPLPSGRRRQGWRFGASGR